VPDEAYLEKSIVNVTISSSSSSSQQQPAACIHTSPNSCQQLNSQLAAAYSQLPAVSSWLQNALTIMCVTSKSDEAPMMAGDDGSMAGRVPHLPPRATF